MSRRSVLLLVLCLGVGASFWFFQRSRQTHSWMEAPSFELKDVKNQTVKSVDLPKKPRIVHFWASWCPPCLDELPELVQFAKEKGKTLGLEFAFVSNDPKWEGALKVIAASPHDDAALFLIDPDSKVAESFGTFQLPETYLLSAEGRILMKWVGPQRWKGPEFQTLFERLLSQPAPRS